MPIIIHSWVIITRQRIKQQSTFFSDGIHVGAELHFEMQRKK